MISPVALIQYLIEWNKKWLVLDGMLFCLLFILELQIISSSAQFRSHVKPWIELAHLLEYGNSEDDSNIGLIQRHKIRHTVAHNSWFTLSGILHKQSSSLSPLNHSHMFVSDLPQFSELKTIFSSEKSMGNRQMSPWESFLNIPLILSEEKIKHEKCLPVVATPNSERRCHAHQTYWNVLLFTLNFPQDYVEIVYLILFRHIVKEKAIPVWLISLLVWYSTWFSWNVARLIWFHKYLVFGIPCNLVCVLARVHVRLQDLIFLWLNCRSTDCTNNSKTNKLMKNNPSKCSLVTENIHQLAFHCKYTAQ